MKLLIRLLAGIIIVLGISGWLTSVFASQPAISGTGKFKPNPSTQGIEYSSRFPKHSLSLKWPRGSLIFPETNDPDRVNEVYLLGEAFTYQSDLQHLHHHFGSQFFTRNKYKNAKAEYLKALTIKPGAPIIYKNLGMIYYNSRKYKRAEIAYRKALELDPGYTPALAKLALSLVAQKKYVSAEKKFKQAIRAEPSRADHYLNLGHFYYYLKKNYRKAQYSYQKALKLNPRLIKAKSNLRDINRKFRKWKNQQSDFENSWGSDFDYDSSKGKEKPQKTPSYPEESDIAGTWEEENAQHPLF